MSIGTTDIELGEFKEKKKKNIDRIYRKSVFSSNMKRKWYFSETFHTQFCFDIFYALNLVIRSRLDLRLKVRIEIFNVWGEYILYHSNPFTQYYRTV